MTPDKGLGERSRLVVEFLTPEPDVWGSIPTSAVCGLEKRHIFTPEKY